VPGLLHADAHAAGGHDAVFQNHRRYVKSRDDGQLAGAYAAPGTGLSTSCDPNASYVTPRNAVYYPCGLIATSFFNDRFDVVTPGVAMDETNIAWAVDMDSHFFNPTGPQALDNFGTFQYLWQTYDQMSCYSNTSANVRVTCITWAQLLRNEAVFGEGCAACPAGSTPKGQGGIAPPGGWSDFNATDTVGNANAAYGFRDEHFVVWMRTAGLPTFRKLYGTLSNPNGFNEGDVITFSIVPNFEVASFGGTKSLVISTSTPTGGRSGVMGAAYLAVGVISGALGALFLLKQIVSPRKLGDTKFIVWRQGTKTA